MTIRVVTPPTVTEDNVNRTLGLVGDWFAKVEAGPGTHAGRLATFNLKKGNSIILSTAGGYYWVDDGRSPGLKEPVSNLRDGLCLIANQAAQNLISETVHIHMPDTLREMDEVGLLETVKIFLEPLLGWVQDWHCFVGPAHSEIRVSTQDGLGLTLIEDADGFRGDQWFAAANKARRALINFGGALIYQMLQDDQARRR